MTTLDGVKRDVVGTNTFTITDFVEDFDCSANDEVAVIANVLATLIRELGRKGIINADITA